jgi:hypothetical protein
MMPAVPPGTDPPPQPPVEPDPGDCCGEGCVNCVFDVHEAAVARYEQALARWRECNPGRIPPVK